MSKEPMMRLQTPDARARRQAIREQLANRVETLIEQFRLLEDNDPPVKSGTGKWSESSGGGTFDEKKHPRGEDGRFAKAPSSSSKTNSTTSTTIDLDEHLRRANEKIDEDRKKREEIWAKADEEENQRKFPPLKKPKNGEILYGDDAFPNFEDRPVTRKGKQLITYSRAGIKLTLTDDDKTSLSEDYKKKMLRTFADMHDMYPGHPTTNLRVKSETSFQKLTDKLPGARKGETVGAWVSPRDKKSIYINGNGKHWAAIGSDFNDKFEGGIRYTMIHEFGHQYDNNVAGSIAMNRFVGGSTREIHRKYKKDITDYGKTNVFEGYAESFADWHFSKGKTKNPATLAYAKHEKWIGFDKSLTGKPIKKASPVKRFIDDYITPFEGDEVVTLAVDYQKDLIIVDTFDDKIPPFIINNGEIVLEDSFVV